MQEWIPGELTSTAPKTGGASDNQGTTYHLTGKAQPEAKRAEKQAEIAPGHGESDRPISPKSARKGAKL